MRQWLWMASALSGVTAFFGLSLASLRAAPSIPDAELTIPREDLFDELKEVTADEINAIGLYPRYPASWKVID
ncbi:MAG: hypothetical protein QGG53_11375, partial [Planctomycetota bacterium]|nr:hypothetical protein [Planctomycetota bacterium]